MIISERFQYVCQASSCCASSSLYTKVCTSERRAASSPFMILILRHCLNASRIGSSASYEVYITTIFSAVTVSPTSTFPDNSILGEISESNTSLLNPWAEVKKSIAWIKRTDEWRVCENSHKSSSSCHWSSDSQCMRPLLPTAIL